MHKSHPRALREGEVLRQFQDFREKFWSKFWISLYILYIFTSPSAQSQLRETFSPKSPSRMTLACMTLIGESFFFFLKDDYDDETTALRTGK